MLKYSIRNIVSAIVTTMYGGWVPDLSGWSLHELYKCLTIMSCTWNVIIYINCNLKFFLNFENKTRTKAKKKYSLWNKKTEVIERVTHQEFSFWYWTWQFWLWTFEKSSLVLHVLFVIVNFSFSHWTNFQVPVVAIIFRLACCADLRWVEQTHSAWSDSFIRINVG